MSQWEVRNSETHVGLSIGGGYVSIPLDDVVKVANAIVRAARMAKAHNAKKT